MKHHDGHAISISNRFLLVLTATTLFLNLSKTFELAQTRGTKVVTKTNEEMASFGISWALVVGIDHYMSTDLPTLRYATNDPMAFTEMISKSGALPFAQLIPFLRIGSG